MSRLCLVLLGVLVGALAAAGTWIFWRRAPASTPLPAVPGTVVLGDAGPSLPIPNEAGETASRMSMFRGDVRHSGRIQAHGPSLPSILWSVSLAGRITAQAVESPSGDILIGDHSGTFQSFSPHGTVRFTKQLGGPIYATALAEDGKILIGADSRIVTSLSAQGELRFRAETNGDADTGFVADSGRYYFAAGSELLAMAPDGGFEWKFQAHDKIFTTPALGRDGTIYVGSQDDFLYALAPTGDMRWAFRTGGDCDSSPAVSDDGAIVFGSDDRKVYALEPDGTLRFVVEVDGMVRAPVLIRRDGSFVVGTLGPTPRLYALDGQTGDIVWTFDVGETESADLGLVSGVVEDADGNLYFGSYDGYVYSLNGRGELRWAIDLEGDVDASPLLASDGVLYIGTDGRRFVAIADRNR